MLGASLPLASISPGHQISTGSRHAYQVCRLSALAALVVAIVSPTHSAGAQDRTAARPEPTADPPRPLALVKESVARVLALVQSQPAGAPLTGKRRAEIRRVAEDLFDFDEMARRTLGQHWKDRSPQEQVEFVRIFIDVLEGSYLTVIGTYPVTAVTFQSESVSGSYAQVRSRIITDRRADIPIEYRLLQAGGRWQVYDVVADGVSVISNYRSQFNTIIRTSSFTRLLERLRNREAHVLPRQGL